MGYSIRYATYQDGKPVVMSIGQKLIVMTHAYGEVFGTLNKLGDLLLEITGVFDLRYDLAVNQIIPITYQDIIAWKPFKEWECQQYIEKCNRRSLLNAPKKRRGSTEDRGGPN